MCWSKGTLGYSRVLEGTARTSPPPSSVPDGHGGASCRQPSPPITTSHAAVGLFRHRHAGGTSAHVLPAVVGSFVAALTMWVRAVVTPVAFTTADSMQASCSAWASQGMCDNQNRNYMLSNCPRSCCLAGAAATNAAPIRVATPPPPAPPSVEALLGATGAHSFARSLPPSCTTYRMNRNTAHAIT